MSLCAQATTAISVQAAVLNREPSLCGSADTHTAGASGHRASRPVSRFYVWLRELSPPGTATKPAAATPRRGRVSGALLRAASTFRGRAPRQDGTQRGPGGCSWETSASGRLLFPQAPCHSQEAVLPQWLKNRGRFNFRAMGTGTATQRGCAGGGDAARTSGTCSLGTWQWEESWRPGILARPAEQDSHGGRAQGRVDRCWLWSGVPVGTSQQAQGPRVAVGGRSGVRSELAESPAT